MLKKDIILEFVLTDLQLDDICTKSHSEDSFNFIRQAPRMLDCDT